MSDQIHIEKIGTQLMMVPIIGTAPLIMNRFSEKAKRMMLDNMQGRKSQKENKDPEAEYRAAIYRLKGGEGYGMPAIAFKAATVGGVRFYSGLTMTACKQYMFFHGEPGDGDEQAYSRIEGEPRMREDVVRVGRGGADLRYRPEFPEWSTTLTIRYVTSALTSDSVLSLVEAGGMGVGVGEWRPEKDGAFGTYQIDTTRDVQFVK
jgi:hypothetical protein